MKKLAIITTHPIQYNAPLFKMLQERGNVDLKVFYTWSQIEKEKKFDPGFGINIDWDIPLLDGYNYCFSENISKNPSSGSFFGIDNPNLIEEIDLFSPNAILLYGWSFKSHLKSLFYFSKKIPILFRGDSTLLDEKKGIKKILRRYCLKFIYSKINFAMYTGIANKNYFLAHGLKPSQLVFMPHAIDIDRFAKNENNVALADSLKATLNIPKDAVVFLFVGKLEPKKNPNILVDIFLESNFSAHLVFVGNGVLQQQLKTKSSKYSNIHFLSFQNQSKMPSIYLIADVFVLPSNGPGETWGLAINEAMAAGKAIIASSACGAAVDLVKDNGFVFEKNNKSVLKEHLSFFAMNKNAAIEMGKRSLEIIKEYNYTNDCIAIENTLKLI